MVVIKYALCCCLIALGLFGFSKRDAVRDAYNWDPTIEKTLVRTFDPQAVAEANRLPIPERGIRIAQPADTRTAPLPAVAREVPGISIQGGSASIGGQVFGPTGQPVAGATVRVQRLVEDKVTSVDLSSDASGFFTFGRLLGGRYRVWAWQAPGLAQLDSEVTFLEDGSNRAFRLDLQAPTDIRLEVDAAASSVPLGGSTTVSMTIANPVVNNSGQVARVGRAGDLVVLTGGGAFTGQSASSVTDGAGMATFPVPCTTVGTGTITLATPYFSDSVTITCEAPPTTVPPALPGQPPTAPVPGVPAPTGTG
ncbi:MAG: carboxypeptidase regulatory-like domain-containing protein [Acidimicrobiales bacterium]